MGIVIVTSKDHNFDIEYYDIRIAHQTVVLLSPNWYAAMQYNLYARVCCVDRVYPLNMPDRHLYHVIQMGRAPFLH